MANSKTNGELLHSMARIFNHDLDKVIEKLNNPENKDMFNLTDSYSIKIKELGNRLCANSDWDGVIPGKENEFRHDLRELKDLFLNMSNTLWSEKVS